GLSFGKPLFTSPVGSALPTILVAPSRPSTLFATMFATPQNHPIVLRSDDSGQHWAVVADVVESLGENPFELLAIDALDENKLYVAGDGYADGYAIAESDDEGEHLEPLAEFNDVQAVKSCVADLCTDACAYYSGVGLWPVAVCGAKSSPTVPDDPARAGAGGD